MLYRESRFRFKMNKLINFFYVLFIGMLISGCFKIIDITKYRGEKLIPYNIPFLKSEKRVIIYPYKNSSHAKGLFFDTSDIDKLSLDYCVPDLITGQSGHPDEYWVRFHFDIPLDIEKIEKVQLVLFAHGFGLERKRRYHSLFYERGESNSRLRGILERQIAKSQLKLIKAIEDTDDDFFMVYELDPEEVLNYIKKESYGKLHLIFSFSKYALSNATQKSARKWTVPGGGVDFASNQHPLEEIRPRLIIDYESKSAQKIQIQKGNIALIPFTNKTNPNNQENILGEMIIDLLKSNLQRSESGLEFVDRVSVEDIIKELTLTLSGLVKDDEIKKVGRLLSANYLLLGDYETENNKLKISCRLVETETTKIITAFDDIGNVEDLDSITKNISELFLRKVTLGK